MPDGKYRQWSKMDYSTKLWISPYKLIQSLRRFSAELPFVRGWSRFGTFVYKPFVNVIV